jgi:hypothetical protein
MPRPYDLRGPQGALPAVLAILVLTSTLLHLSSSAEISKKVLSLKILELRIPLLVSRDAGLMEA